MSDIDVSKCKHYKNKTCIADYLLTDMSFSEAKCELSPNCYFRQLQQLKAKNEELKYLVFSWEEINKLQEKYKQCLDEIEHILEVNKKELDECLHNDIDGQILQKIKEVKGNG